MRHVIKRSFFSKRFFALALFFFSGVAFLLSLGPKGADSRIIFEIKRGEGFSEIAARLEKEGIIRSRLSFEILGILIWKYKYINPGVYTLNPGETSVVILREIAPEEKNEAEVRIPEGATVYKIDSILSDAKVIIPGSLITYASSTDIEGRLFPDTYRFLFNSFMEDVVKKILDNFDLKTKNVLKGKNEAEIKKIVVLASILEKEVPEAEDMKIVAGILLKRIGAGVPLRVDATICYIKEVLSGSAVSSCYPLQPLDFKRESDYNTYLHAGLPPRAIGNPGISAISAAVAPKNSPYWYYLSDPRTKKTIFAKTFEEHNENRARYLGL